MGKSLIPEGKWSRLTLLWSFTQFIIMAVIECIIIYMSWKNKKYYSNVVDSEDEDIKNYSALIVYQALFIVAMVYQLYLAVDTLLKFSTIDLIALAVFNTMCLGYSVTQYLQSNKHNSSLDDKIKEKNVLINSPDDTKYRTIYFELINIGIMSVFTIGWWYITFRLYKVFGWNVFKQFGADVRLKQRLKLYNVLITLLKLTSFFIALFITQYFALVLNYGNKSGKEKIDYFTELAVPAIIILGSGFGIIAVAKVSRIYLGIYIFTLCALLGFMASTLLDIEENGNKKYSNSKISLKVTIGCTLVISLITYVVSLINFKNFGLGIPKSINKNNLQSGQSVTNQQKRLSID